MGQDIHGNATTTDATSNFVEGDIPSRLHDVAGGLLGLVSNLVFQACVIAFKENASRVTREHLSAATDVWAIPLVHRCLQRHGNGWLPDVEGGRPATKKFKSAPRFKSAIGCFHIDIAEVRTEQGRLHMFVAIDRTSQFAFVELHDEATAAVSREFLLRLIAAVPYRIHTVLTDNGIQYTKPGAGGSAAIANGESLRAHVFEHACAANDIEHHIGNTKHPWTNGQVERMNRTIYDATVRRSSYESHEQLRRHLADFVAAYNFARRLKTLNGFTPYEFICKAWASQPERFRLNPLQQMPGLNT